MEIEPIAPTRSTATDRWRLWEERIRARPETAADTPAGAPSFPATTPDADGLDVELAEHPGTGAQMVRVVDSDSGHVVSEIPHHKVLDLVAQLLQQNERNKEGGSGGQH